MAASMCRHFKCKSVGGIPVARVPQLSAVDDVLMRWRHFLDVVSQKSSPSSAVGVCLCSCFHFTALGSGGTMARDLCVRAAHLFWR